MIKLTTVCASTVSRACMADIFGTPKAICGYNCPLSEEGALKRPYVKLSYAKRAL